MNKDRFNYLNKLEQMNQQEGKFIGDNNALNSFHGNQYQSSFNYENHKQKIQKKLQQRSLNENIQNENNFSCYNRNPKLQTFGNENYGTFNNEAYQQSDIQQFQSIKPQIEQQNQLNSDKNQLNQPLYISSFEKNNELSRKMSQDSFIHKKSLQIEIYDSTNTHKNLQQIVQNNQNTFHGEQNLDQDLKQKEQILINKRKYILQGFSRIKTNDHKQSINYFQDQNKSQIQNSLKNQTSRITEKSRLTEKKSILIQQNNKFNDISSNYDPHLQSIPIYQNDISQYEQNSLNYKDIKNKHKYSQIISSSQINAQNLTSQGQITEVKQYISTGSPTKNKYDSNNSSDYVSYSQQHVQMMKNFIQTKSQQVKDLQLFLVKQFQEIQNQKQKYRKFSNSMNKMINQMDYLRNQILKEKKYINQDLKDMKKYICSKIQQVAKKFMKELIISKSSNQQKSIIIKNQQHKIKDLQLKIKQQQEIINILNQKKKTAKVIITTQNQQKSIKKDKSEKQITPMNKIRQNQFKESIQQNNKSNSKLQKSKSKFKNSRFDYFQHFQQSMSKQTFQSKPLQMYESPNKGLSRKKQKGTGYIQQDYDNRLQRLLLQVEERKNLVQNKKHNNHSKLVNPTNFNKNDYIAQNKNIQRHFSPLRESNLITQMTRYSPQSPSKYSPMLNKSVSISNIPEKLQKRSPVKKQQNYVYEVKQRQDNSKNDRKQYIKDKIQKIRSVKENQREFQFGQNQDIGVLKCSNLNSYSKTPTKIKKNDQSYIDQSKGKNYHMKSAYFVQENSYKPDLTLTNSYSRPKLSSSFTKSQIKHSNIGYQYPQMNNKKKNMLRQDQYLRQEKQNLNKPYLLGHTKSFIRF